MTPAQARDSLIEGGTPPSIVRLLALQAEDERKLDSNTYVQCPRCKGRHSIHGNFDNLCDVCCITLVCWFPEHESVPFIKEVMKKWGQL